MSLPEPSSASVALEAKLVQGIDQIPAATWDACVGPEQPFLSHAFLAAMEDSGSACQETGWMPLHLVVERGGEMLGCAPMYLKSHSYGEYVFDWGWADAYERAGGSYYPKLQIAVPFTPVPGPRLLLRPDGAADRSEVIRAMLSAAQELGVSSLHVTFCREDEWSSPRRCRAADPHRHPISLVQPRLRHLRRLPGEPQEQQAQDDPQGARAGARAGPDCSRP